RGRGKSDAIDALAVARAALRAPELSRPRPAEEPYPELKLPGAHRDAIVDERRRVQQRERRHLYQRHAPLAVPWQMLPRNPQLARHSGVAPLEASSGRIQRHRLDRGGNRQLNAALHRIAITQARIHPGARAYLERKRAEGKSWREAIRCLKRLLVRVVFQTLKTSPALT